MDSKKNIIIVSGMQRSGTAMLMQMLKASGLSIYEDNVRLADQYNPNGYLEHRDMYNMSNDTSFIENCVNKVVKVFVGKLQFLPKNYTYKIILIRRDVKEVLLSLRKVRRKKETPEYPVMSVMKLNQLERLNEYATKYMGNNPNIDLLLVDYKEILVNPEKISIQIASFLELNLDTVQMSSKVNLNLYRSNDISNILITDRAPSSISKLIDKYTVGKVFCEIGIGEGDNLNLVSTASRKYGVEIEKYGVTRCKEKYPTLDVFHASIFDIIGDIDFDVCFMWLTYPKCREVVEVILENKKDKQITILIGLNYYYHLEENNSKYKRYIEGYIQQANAATWNENIKQHLESLQNRGYSFRIEKTYDDITNECFHVAIVDKKKDM